MSFVSRAPEYFLRSKKIKNPDSFDFEIYRLTNNGRLATGEMVIDHIAIKRKFNFSYTVIDHESLANLRGILFGDDKTELDFRFIEDNEVTIINVYVGALKYKKFRTGSLWYYKDASFSLIEI